MSNYADPVELARIELGPQFEPSFTGRVVEHDNHLIKRLHTEARDHGFIDGRYWVDTAQGFVVPDDIPAKTEDFDGKLIELRDLLFAGSLVGYHKFSIGEKVGAWCLRFSEGILAPGLEEMPQRDKLWIPAVSIRSIEVL